MEERTTLRGGFIGGLYSRTATGSTYEMLGAISPGNPRD